MAPDLLPSRYLALSLLSTGLIAGSLSLAGNDSEPFQPLALSFHDLQCS